PSGWRNKATTANQSARAPTTAASQKASSQAQPPWRPMNRLSTRPASAATRHIRACNFLRRNCCCGLGTGARDGGFSGMLAGREAEMETHPTAHPPSFQLVHPYSNGPNTLRGKGDALTLELGRRVPIHCRAL